LINADFLPFEASQIQIKWTQWFDLHKKVFYILKVLIVYGKSLNSLKFLNNKHILKFGQNF